MEDSETGKPGLIYGLMAKVMAEVSFVGKDGTANQTLGGFKYRKIDDIYHALHPVMAKHGIFNIPEVLSSETEPRTTKSGGMFLFRILTVKYRFFAPDGSFVDCVVRGEGSDTGDKSTSKALAMAHKYALVQVFTLPTDEPDPDGEGPDPETLTGPTATAPAKKQQERKPAAEPPKVDPPSQELTEQQQAIKAKKEELTSYLETIFVKPEERAAFKAKWGGDAWRHMNLEDAARLAASWGKIVNSRANNQPDAALESALALEIQAQKTAKAPLAAPETAPAAESSPPVQASPGVEPVRDDIF